MARRFVIGDIHGAYKALAECFEKVSFDRDKDMLICLGDVCDGWPEVSKVFDELIAVNNLVYILGNHDKWALDWFQYHKAPSIWRQQGGQATMASYQGEIPGSHVQILTGAHLYFILENKLFVHGGIDPARDIEDQDEQIFLWDRGLVYDAIRNHQLSPGSRLTGFDEIYVGHTPTINFDSLEPVRVCEVTLMDTGAGWPGGVLTIMDIDTKEYYQSTFVDELYKNYKGRG